MSTFLKYKTIQAYGYQICCSYCDNLNNSDDINSRTITSYSIFTGRRGANIWLLWNLNIYLYISLFILVTYTVQCPAKNGLQVTLNTKIYLLVLVTVRPDKHEMSGRCRLNAGPTSTTLTHYRTSPDQTPLPDGKSGSLLQNHSHWSGTI